VLALVLNRFKGQGSSLVVPQISPRLPVARLSIETSARRYPARLAGITPPVASANWPEPWASCRQVTLKGNRLARGTITPTSVHLLPPILVLAHRISMLRRLLHQPRSAMLVFYPRLRLALAHLSTTAPRQPHHNRMYLCLVVLAQNPLL